MRVSPFRLRLWLAATRWLGVVLGALVGAVAHGQDKQITWGVVDWPPFMVLDNSAAPASAAQLRDGFIDRVMAEIARHSPSYSHKFQLINRQRLWKAIGEGENFCYASSFKTPEREKIAYFTPATLIPPVALVIRSDLKERLTKGAASVSLASLVANREFDGRIEATRSYGPFLDKVLNQSMDFPKRETGPQTGFLVRPLGLGRHDYILEYPMTVEYMRQKSPMKHELEVIPLDEQLDWATGYVACTRNAWGKDAIREIDSAIREASKGQTYRQTLAPWLPAAMMQKNRARLDVFYDERAKRASTTVE